MTLHQFLINLGATEHQWHCQVTEHYACPATSGTTRSSTSYSSSEDSTPSSSCGPNAPCMTSYLKRLFNQHNDEPIAKGSPRCTQLSFKTPQSRYKARPVSISPTPDHKKAAKPNSDPRTKQTMEMLAEMGQAEVKARKRDGTIKTRMVTPGRPVVAWVDTARSYCRSKPYKIN